MCTTVECRIVLVGTHPGPQFSLLSRSTRAHSASSAWGSKVAELLNTTAFAADAEVPTPQAATGQHAREQTPPGCRFVVPSKVYQTLSNMPANFTIINAAVHQGATSTHKKVAGAKASPTLLPAVQVVAQTLVQSPEALALCTRYQYCT